MHLKILSLPYYILLHVLSEAIQLGRKLSPLQGTPPSVDSIFGTLYHGAELGNRLF